MTKVNETSHRLWGFIHGYSESHSTLFFNVIIFLFLAEFFTIGMAKLKVVPSKTLIDKVIKVSLFFGLVH